ncbi:hypothetical protein AVEN_242721-1 [Araneus ventricosus]|uniref:Uncharacterized protein n=1 Tax=Araneus ventricosus TaxID=182803 RepID=A0A4Y2SU13_ARAVE|nr:hypothetical protein AVEN_242721-1 [Araneus ventricosus]
MVSHVLEASAKFEKRTEEYSLFDFNSVSFGSFSGVKKERRRGDMNLFDFSLIINFGKAFSGDERARRNIRSLFRFFNECSRLGFSGVKRGARRGNIVSSIFNECLVWEASLG